MISLIIFLAFVVVLIIGERGMRRVKNYENRYGAIALIGIAGALITGIVAFFMTFVWWSFVIIAAIYVFLQHVRPRIFS